MSTGTIIFIAILVVAANAVAVYLLSRRNAPKQDDAALKLLSDQMGELRRTVDAKIGEANRQTGEAIHRQFSESQKLLREINEQMQKSLVDVTKEQTKTNEATSRFITIAQQLSNLEKVLTHQKQRGNWGEASLELILGNFLPPNQFKMQFQFKDGETVDAALFTKDGIIPIDAKFSLDNYNRLVNAIDEPQRAELEKIFKNDLKNRIDETSKYVRPKEGTLPIAFMYIPAEAIYYDLLVGEVNAGKVNARNLIDYAYREKKVIIVSPTTFMAYLAIVNKGLEAFKIEENFKGIQKNIDALGKHLKAYDDYYKRLGNALSTTVNHYNAGGKELGKIDKDVLRITGNSPELDAALIDRPSLEE